VSVSDWPASGSLGPLIGQVDWARTPLGPYAAWPAALRAAVRLVLPAKAQIVMFIGPEFVALYNEAYAPTIGDKHPRALGRPARENWSELWDDLEPLLQKVYRTGETLSAADRPFYIERFGYPETVYFDISYSGMFDDDGTILGVLCIVSETTERMRASSALKASEASVRRLASIILSSDDAILSTELDMRIASWNWGAERLYGYTAEEAVGKPVTLIVPEDRLDEEAAIIARISRGERVEPHETKRRHKDGRLIDVLLTVSPVHDEQGKIVGASKIAHDISARKEAERLQRVLMGELKHRIKNIIATVQAIARQTLGSDEAMRPAREAFAARLHSLARAHDLLTRESWDGADLGEVVNETLLPYQHDRFEIDGPRQRLSPRVVLAMSLALHELATNAAKYGALSVPSGRVSIGWTVDAGNDGRLELTWQEHGGPKVAAPNRRGFGSRLIEDVLAAELQGTVEILYEPQGLLCKVSAPMDKAW
jgi:PAS domain S-box-containing protein